MTTAIEQFAPPPAVLRSAAALQEQFAQGLERMLDHDALGVFILVLANTNYAPQLLAPLQPRLHSLYATWCARFDAGDLRASEAAPDDVAVFLALRDLGLDRLAAPRRRRIGPWEIQFNQLRALRPSRMSHAAVRALHQRFDPGGFHFNKPFLRKEIFWQGKIAGRTVSLLYNKFPFAPLHGLLVPDPDREQPQYLEHADHGFAWRLLGLLGAALPGIGLGFNAYGAYASVNHLHFHLFVRAPGEIPIEQPDWRHNGGTRAYPLPVERFDNEEDAWDALDRCLVAGRAFNLIYRPGRMYLAERAFQGSCPQADWTSGFAWSELGGIFTLFDEARFERLAAHEVQAELERVGVRAC